MALKLAEKFHEGDKTGVNILYDLISYLQLIQKELRLAHTQVENLATIFEGVTAFKQTHILFTAMDYNYRAELVLG